LPHSLVGTKRTVTRKKELENLEKEQYTKDEVFGILAHLVNGIGLCLKGDIMPERYKQQVELDGESRWVTGKTIKDLLDSYLSMCIETGKVVPGFVMEAKEKESECPTLGEYLDAFVKLYKNKQQTLTKENRKQFIKFHIVPKFGNTSLDKITTSSIQVWFNELEEAGYSHETLLKIKNIMSPALDAAVEDGYIIKNPMKSTRLVIGGRPTEHHKAIPHDRMELIKEKISTIDDDRTKFMITLLCYTGMRMEEVLGLRWEDIDYEENWIHIQRAVVHPGRNQAEIKPPKSKTSDRRIPLPDAVKRYLVPRSKKGFIISARKDPTNETPMNYTEARNTFRKIQNVCGIQEYTAHDFRDTCATEWRESGIPMDVIAHLLGHSKSDITENRYVKYRDELYQGVRAVMNDPKPTK